MSAFCTDVYDLLDNSYTTGIHISSSFKVTTFSRKNLSASREKKCVFMSNVLLHVHAILQRLKYLHSNLRMSFRVNIQVSVFTYRKRITVLSHRECTNFYHQRYSVTMMLTQLMYVLIALTDLNDLFECIPTILITIIFSFKLASLMMNNDKVGNDCARLYYAKILNKALLHNKALLRCSV